MRAVGVHGVCGGEVREGRAMAWSGEGVEVCVVCAVECLDVAGGTLGPRGDNR